MDKIKCCNCNKVIKKVEPGSTVYTGNWAGDFYPHCTIKCKENCKRDHD